MQLEVGKEYLVTGKKDISQTKVRMKVMQLVSDVMVKAEDIATKFTCTLPLKYFKFEAVS